MISQPLLDPRLPFLFENPAQNVFFLLSGDGLSRQSTKALFASVLNWTCTDNKLVTEALADLRELEQSGTAIVGFQAVFDTWAPADDPGCLARRKATLAQAVQGWGNCEVSDQCGDPLLGMVATLPAVTRSFPAQAAAPLPDALFLMPLSRPALPWREGSWLLRTPDGKLAPVQPGSPLQTAWVEIGVAPMGGRQVRGPERRQPRSLPAGGPGPPPLDP